MLIAFCQAAVIWDGGKIPCKVAPSLESQDVKGQAGFAGIFRDQKIQVGIQ